MAKPERRDLGKERHWRRVLGQWRRSGLTGRDFCAERGLGESSFYAWRREIERRDREKRAERTRTSVTPASRPAFVKVTVDAAVPSAAVSSAASASAASAIEVVVAGRRVLRVRAGFDAELLRQLVRVLEEPAC